MIKKTNYKNKWVITDTGVHILLKEGYRITYNPSTIYTLNLKRIKDPKFKFEEDVDTEETALYINSTDSYLILEGDFRKAFERCKTKEECKEVFRKYSPLYRSKFCSGIDAALEV